MTTYIKETLSIPSLIGCCIEHNASTVKDIAKAVAERSVTSIVTIARGSSDSSASFFKYAATISCGLPVSRFNHSAVTLYNAKLHLKNALVVAISVSGKSTDTVLVAESAKKSGALLVAVTNNASSPLAKLADFHLDLKMGEEKSLVSAKTFMAQLAVLGMLASELSGGTVTYNTSHLPYTLEKLSAKHNEIKMLATYNKYKDNVIILSRGLTIAVAEELSRKLIELAGVFGTHFSTADFMHGPIALVKENTSVIMLAPNTVFKQEFIDMATRLSILGADLTVFSEIPELKKISAETLSISLHNSLEAPFAHAYCALLYAGYLAEARGLNPDTPRNIKKETNTK